MSCCRCRRLPACDEYLCGSDLLVLLSAAAARRPLPNPHGSSDYYHSSGRASRVREIGATCIQSSAQARISRCWRLADRALPVSTAASAAAAEPQVQAQAQSSAAAAAALRLLAERMSRLPQLASSRRRRQRLDERCCSAGAANRRQRAATSGDIGASEERGLTHKIDWAAVVGAATAAAAAEWP